MFTTPNKLAIRTGSNPLNRDKFIESLVNELKENKSKDKTEQVLANLSNFAYDPINFSIFKKYRVVDIFLNELFVGTEKTIEFSIGGLCNLCLDADHKQYIISNNGIYFIGKCLEFNNLNIVLSAITTLLFLVTPKSKPALTSLGILKCMVQFSHSSCPQLRNLSKIYLEDICTKEQVQHARKLLKLDQE